MNRKSKFDTHSWCGFGGHWIKKTRITEHNPDLCPDCGQQLRTKPRAYAKRRRK